MPHEGTIRVAAAATETFSGNWVVVGITFLCRGAGVSTLAITTTSWGSAIPESPTPEPELLNGTIKCVERPTNNGTLKIGSQTMAVGETGLIRVEANRDAFENGVGAWTIDVGYEADAVSVQDCLAGTLPEGDAGSLTCNAEFAPATVRITGASARGLAEHQVLATVAFRCEQAGKKNLSVSIGLWAYSTIAIPQEPRWPEVITGSITCVEPASPQPSATPTIAAVLARAGEGGERQPGSPVWLAVLLATGGAALASSAVAARRRV